MGFAGAAAGDGQAATPADLRPYEVVADKAQRAYSVHRGERRLRRAIHFQARFETSSLLLQRAPVGRCRIVRRGRSEGVVRAICRFRTRDGNAIVRSRLQTYEDGSLRWWRVRTAGANGTMSIPSEFVLRLVPFEGAEAVEVVARLRYRIREGRLGIGYRLANPEKVLQEAFDTLKDAVEKEIGQSVIVGNPDA